MNAARTLPCLALLGVLFACPGAVAAPAGHPQAEPAAGPPEVPLTPSVPASPLAGVPQVDGTAEDPRQRPVSLSIFETDIRDALNELAQQTGVNILMTQDVRGSVTAELRDVPLEQAIATLVSPLGLAWRWTGSYYLVGLPDPRSLAFGNLSESAVIPVRYADATRIAELLSDFYRPFVKADPERNRLMVTAPLTIIEQVQSDVARLDRPPAEIEVRVVVAALTKQASQELGIDGLQFDTQATAAPALKVTPAGVALSYQQLVTQLRLLEQRQQADIRADPSVRVTEGKPLTLFAGQRQFYLIPSPQTSPRLEAVDSGVRLQLTARSLGNGEVSLSVAPSVSQVIPDAQVVPTLQSNELSTTVRLRSGQTAVLATMDLSRAVTGEQGAPGLTRLPLVGWLFRRESRDESQRRLVIFVTPEILPESPGVS